MAKETGFFIKMSEQEKSELEALAARLDTSQADTVRLALSRLRDQVDELERDPLAGLR